MSDIRRTLKDETEAARALLANIHDVVGDDDEAILGTVEGETNLIEVIALAVDRLAELKSHDEALSHLVKSYNERRDRLQNQGELLRAAISVALEAAGLKRLELPQATLTIKATPPSAVITDEAALPSKFWKPSDPKLDKRAVLAALKDGETVPGATLSNGGTTLQVRS